ncbi:MAG: ABC transporter substrate-binding protein, partial [Gammaproteobacteria bacterium]|nr:ABC transporter substrate-binding protein [Gammaproteobacteria bacterium]
MKRPDAIRILLLAISFFASSAAAASWNNPYPEEDAGKNILYSAFRERPKTFDPARSYSSNEYLFIAQIYEPPFQYHYLKRPYTLIPLTAESVPMPIYLDKQGHRLPRDASPEAIAFSVYEIRIRPGILYQPHPAFARDADGRYLYHDLSPRDIEGLRAIGDFPHTGTRELVAADYVYQIKRLAHPKLHSPILSVMNDYIVGMKEYATTLKQAHDEIAVGRDSGVYLDLSKFPLAGAEAVDRYSYRVKLHGKYPQLLYWMAMPFFAPMAPEVDRFFSQPGMADKNITLDWYPVGSGAYTLTVNNPNRQMVMERNPNYHEEYYPTEGEPGDGPSGLLLDAGQRLPFIDKVIFNLDKESIPRWNKFLQGYYDRSGVQPEGFDQAIRF